MSDGSADANLPLVGLGAGGHARGLIEALRRMGGFDPVALLDPDVDLHQTMLDGVPIRGGDELLPELAADGIVHFFVGVGSVSTQQHRRRVYERGLASGMEPIVIVHPSAVVASTAVLGPGTVVLAGAVVNPGARIGANVIVNTRAVVEHDCVVGDHTHVATGAALAGGVEVGREVMIGAGSVVRQYTCIGDGAIVGAGAVVVGEVPAGETVVGNPARPLEASHEVGSQL